jgi:hypothetical protein
MSCSAVWETPIDWASAPNPAVGPNRTGPPGIPGVPRETSGFPCEKVFTLHRPGREALISHKLMRFLTIGNRRIFVIGRKCGFRYPYERGFDLKIESGRRL